MDISHIHSLFLECQSVTTDTRKIETESLFIALKGPHFDANSFAKQALEKGAKYAIIDNPNYFIDQRTILVSNSLQTLQELGAFHRKYLKLPIVALTGSNGKTTTKELIYAVLSQKYKVTATQGNLNNHIGVPLTLLSFTEETQIGIVEMGANHQKEIEFLCELATPDYGYITNFGKAHLEGFGGVLGVIKGKSEMYTYLEKNRKTAFINLDDPIQVEKTTKINHYSFGTNNTSGNIAITNVHASPFVAISHEQMEIKTQMIGLYNANNVAVALSIGTYFEVPHLDIKKALENYIPENNRSQIIKKGTNEIILDAYNANPSSMIVAIANFVQLENPSKMMILGDMFELGDESFVEHQTLVSAVLEKAVPCCFVGSHFYECKVEQANVHFFETFDAFSAFITQKSVQNTTLLIKGSRGMALERTIDLLLT